MFERFTDKAGTVAASTRQVGERPGHRGLTATIQAVPYFPFG